MLTGISTNVHPAPYPLGTELPAITYQRITTRLFPTHDGLSALFPLYQIVAWDRTASTARAIRRQVVDTLAPLLGTAFIEDIRDSYDPERKVHRADVDVRWWTSLEEEVGLTAS